MHRVKSRFQNATAKRKNQYSKQTLSIMALSGFSLSVFDKDLALPPGCKYRAVSNDAAITGFSDFHGR